jgi:hypothetical protein
MLEKLVGDEMVRALESGQPLDLLNDLAALRDTLLRADALLNRLRALRGHGESYRGVILGWRTAETGGRAGQRRLNRGHRSSHLPGPPAGWCGSLARGEVIIRSLSIVMVGVGLGYIVTNAIWVVVVVVVIRVMVGVMVGVMIMWVVVMVVVILDLLDVRLDDRLGE